MPQSHLCQRFHVRHSSSAWQIIVECVHRFADERGDVCQMLNGVEVQHIELVHQPTHLLQHPHERVAPMAIASGAEGETEQSKNLFGALGNEVKQAKSK